jgi:hypothetical protein
MQQSNQQTKEVREVISAISELAKLLVIESNNVNLGNRKLKAGLHKLEGRLIFHLLEEIRILRDPDEIF